MISHVLIPLDGSQFAEKSLSAARQLLKSGGRITLVTAVSQPHLAQRLPQGHNAEDTAQLESAHAGSRDYLDRMAHNLRLQGYQVEIEIVPGDPAQVILQIAEEKRADMIVMSTHGRSGLRRVLSGSVTLKVLGEALMPILIVPNRERVEVREPGRVARDPGLAT